MARFPSYNSVIKYDNQLTRERIPEKFLVNIATQVLRRCKTKKRYTHISIIRKSLTRNFRLKHLSDMILHQSFFKQHPDNFRSVTFKGKNGLSNTIRYKLKTNEYRKAESIKLKIYQVLKLRFDYIIEVIEFGSIPIKLATSNSDYDILLKFPDSFTKEQIYAKFDEIKSHLKRYGYKFKSEWRVKAGGRMMKFDDVNSSFSINIGNYEEMLCWNTKLVETYSNLHPDIKDAILLIKIWADRRKLNNPATTHVINSYCHVLMFIAYLIIIRAIPNLRAISPKFSRWEGRKILYRPNIRRLKNTKPDEFCRSHAELVNDGFEDIHIYFQKDLEIILGNNWNIQEAIQGYFYFMGYMFDYKNWDISIYHGGIVESLQKIGSIYETTKLLRVRHPFKPNQIESNSALPWCVDGLKWEFMRGYQLLRNKKWSELYHEATPPSVRDVYDYNIYTYTYLYS
ncbi:hypothetical protein CONCODRAFT_73497 [Conidiobolus coronatus NRRL 28638]|uniref:Poly(A) RNA polymerase mitochondrial-like central palm domain-containing protein n=1 Tax=Conidiobolus coronatus (strain ATCC 28846 / CBS 209.66 / NRRL 28638) TaxID=796925 RepID=A0A137NV84_CONC2|nr:hypothetical protein CONCODRAFT_73497 [Conidiobolus coronatus NRRL 28638]|eukprot:KXN66700.1 hypothetical protein CONCODRAFT_73497 [Conidiobolus coronatus NRRL 28638]